MPAPRKPLGERQNRITRDIGILTLKPDNDSIPSMPAGRWLKATHDAWETLFTAPISAAIDMRSDAPLLLQWVRLMDERERSWGAFRQKRFIRGSMGQEVLSPAWKLIREQSAEITRIEEQLGIGGANRFRLGMQVLEANDILRGIFDDIGEPVATMVNLDDMSRPVAAHDAPAS